VHTYLRRLPIFAILNLQAAKGTTAEPAVFEADKTYSVVADVTYLLSYMKPGMQTKFSLGNFVGNVYNVPVWAGDHALGYCSRFTVQRTQ
jgi:hypothetical protein